ncbi:hypothetical protein IJ579_00025 [bacterium]|nr:hypothetical protein [bacterium]
MKTQSIRNKPYFTGYVTTSGLSKKQAKVFNRIKDVLDAKVADIDHLVLNVNGSSHPYMLEKDYRKAVKYVVMHTQVKLATVPTAQAFTSSSNPKDWLTIVDNLIERHQNSDFYKKTIEAESNRLFARIKRSLFLRK